MPRTKMPRRRATGVLGSAAAGAREEYLARVDAVRAKLERALDERRLELERNFRSLLELHKADLHKTMAQLREEESKSWPTADKAKLKLSAESQRDDGYITDATDASNTQKTTRPGRRVSRSLSRANMKMPSSIATSVSSFTPRTKRRRSSSVSSAMGPPRSVRPRYRTPINRGHGAQYPPITPKVAPNTSMAILRKPRDGEMVLSLKGSPLMVNSINGERRPNCNIPLADGTMLSLLPSRLNGNAELPVDQMRPETRQELKMLQSNLNVYVKKLDEEMNSVKNSKRKVQN